MIPNQPDEASSKLLAAKIHEIATVQVRGQTNLVEPFFVGHSGSLAADQGVEVRWKSPLPEHKLAVQADATIRG